jgi:hypothetical protein
MATGWLTYCDSLQLLLAIQDNVHDRIDYEAVAEQVGKCGIWRLAS